MIQRRLKALDAGAVKTQNDSPLVSAIEARGNPTGRAAQAPGR
jgi:hypothetical protein